MKRFKVINNVNYPKSVVKYFETKEEVKNYIRDYSANHIKRTWKHYRRDFIVWQNKEYVDITKKEIEHEIRYIKSNYFTIERLHIKTVKEWY